MDEHHPAARPPTVLDKRWLDMTEHRQHQPTTDVARHREHVGQLRVADTDRQAVADRLGTALREGRLDLAEYDERLRRAYAARTYHELDDLLTDLPAPTSTGHQSPWRVRWVCCLPIPYRQTHLSERRF